MADAGPLNAIRVLDLSRVLAGPYAAMTLGDMGAEVIKVEQPGDGDETRAWGPPWAGGESAYYLSINRNKRGLTLNLKHPVARRILLDLVRRSDVLIENFKRGTMERMELGDDVLWETNPGLVHASITGFGNTGPYRDYPGYDFVVQGMAGIMSITGAVGGEPMKVGVAIVDVTTALYAVSGILAALYARKESGRGQRVDVSLLESALAWLANVGQNYLVSGAPPKRFGNAHPNVVPYQVFQAADRPLALAVGNDRQFRIFCNLAGRPELADDPRFITNTERLANRDELIPTVQSLIAGRPAAEWLTLLNDAGVPAGPINTVPQALADPQVQALGIVHTLPHPTAGEIQVIGPPMHLSQTPIEPHTAPPRHGEHTEEVLHELLGLTESEITRLRAEQAI
ncbi:MAG: CaiB/BaiF CoA transferase family protein [Dehalococcoidia bacterium]